MNINIYNNKYKGFLLIELIIAIGVFSVIAMLSLNFYSNILKLNLENELELKAINLAHNYIEKLQSNNNFANEFKIDNYNIKIENLYIKKGQYNIIFNMIKLTVTWIIFNKEKSISFLTGKVS